MAGRLVKDPAILNTAAAPRGFTLVELLITITIIAVLVGIVVVILQPAEIFRRTRDTRRLADLAALQNMALTYTSTVDIIDIDGPSLATCSDESSPTIYVSIPQGETLPAPPPSGWAWKQFSDVTLTRLDGTGWVPINFSSLTLGETVGRLPVDPVNRVEGSQRFFYSYGCRRKNGVFEFNAKLESAEFGPGGKKDAARRDGGDTTDVYEVGTIVGVLPTAGVY